MINYKCFIISMLLLSISIMCLAAPKYYVADTFTEFRNMSFDVNPTELKIKKENPGHIYGVFMETGLDDAAYSLRCFKEGTISIYFTNGGGLIGIGKHESARNKGMELISFSEKFKKYAIRTNTRELPSPGETYFYLLSFDGVYLLTVKTDDVENTSHKLFPLYMKAQDVLAEARKIDESRD